MKPLTPEVLKRFEIQEEITVLYVVAYYVNGVKVFSAPFMTTGEAERVQAIMNDRAPDTKPTIETWLPESEQRPGNRPSCWKCGSTKVYDLFKGEHCPRCNDWC